MTCRRIPGPAPQGDPPSVALLRALGVLQQLEGGEPIDDLDMLASESGIVDIELWSLIHAGVRAGALLVDEDDGIALSERGWAWWRRRYADE